MTVTAQAAAPEQNRLRWLPPVALALLLGGAAWLRWQYITAISLYVDEFTTLWAARQVLERGLPLMPSGVLYTRGFLASYLTAAVIAPFGANLTLVALAGRLLSLLFGLLTLLSTYGLGRSAWGDARIGWLAAVGMALLPEAIIWQSRARFYAQLQWLALLTVWAAWRLVETEEGRPLWRRALLFALLFAAALFTQEEMLLLLPILGLLVVWRRGFHFLRRKPVMAALLACGGAVAARFLLEVWGQPGYFETIQAQRPYVQGGFDVAGAWRVYGPLLMGPERLPWTLGMAVAFLLASREWGKAGGEWRQLHRATFFFGMTFLFVLAVILVLVGGTWREARYLLLVQPFWLLCGAAGMVQVGDWLAARLEERFRPAARRLWLGVLTLACAALLWPGAQVAMTTQVEGYDRVLAQVAARRQPAELILSPQPPACAFVLGRCDFYAIQRGYEEFVISQPPGGALVDRWTGSLLLNDEAALRRLLQAETGLWFVTDSFRLATRYEADFLRTVIANFSPAVSEQGVLALHATGVSEPDLVHAAEHAPPLVFGPLALTGVAWSEPVPGGRLNVELSWQATAPVDRQYNSSLRLVAADGSVLAQQDGPPAGGIIPTNLFFEQPLPDFKQLALPEELPAGPLHLELVLYGVETVEATGPSQVVAVIRE